MKFVHPSHRRHPHLLQRDLGFECGLQRFVMLQHEPNEIVLVQKGDGLLGLLSFQGRIAGKAASGDENALLTSP